MIALFLTTIISCSQAQEILNRIQFNNNLYGHQKNELIEEVKKLIPNCPLKNKFDGR
jgi:hypothetical protein